MHFMGVNLFAVLVSALATMVAGFVWYSPALFARPWTILMGYDPDDKAKLAEMQKSAGPSYAMSLVASILVWRSCWESIREVSNVTTAVSSGWRSGWRLRLGIVTPGAVRPMHCSCGSRSSFI